METQTPSRRIPQLDGLRAFAFGSVFLQHAFHIPLLWMGVDCFFVLSGFLITGILMRQPTNLGAIKVFYLKRARRILPPYFLALLLVAGTLGVAWTTDWPYLAFFTANIGIAFQKMKTGALSPLWSLSVEEHFYVLWPFVILFLPRKRSLQIACAILISAPLLRAIFTPLFRTHFPIYFLTPFRADLLAAGALLALTIDRHHKKWAFASRYLMAVGFVGIATLAVLGYKTIGNMVISNMFSYESSLFFFTGLMASLVQMEHGVVYALLTLRPLRYIGSISYLAYLIHRPMLALFHSPWTALATTLVICTLSWELMEKRLIGRTAMRRPSVVQLHSHRPGESGPPNSERLAS